MSEMCRLFDSTTCANRKFVMACWMDKGKIPKNCMSPHKCHEDECRPVGTELIYRRGAIYGGKDAQKSGFIQRKLAVTEIVA